MTDKSRIEKLLEKYAFGTASVAEVTELTQMLRSNYHDEEIKKLLERMAGNTKVNRVYDQSKLDDIIQTILGSQESAKVISLTKTPLTRRRLFTRIAAAAVIVLLLSVGGYLYFKQSPQKQIAQTQQKRFKNDVAPGGNKAILTLANGTQIILDSVANGILTQQGNVKVIKLDSGQLAYEGSGFSLLGEAGMVLNTISTPRGGQYQIVLADGSKVWLNAASSLKFPTAFAGKERNVELTGEGYFEVAHNPTKPFKVSVNGINVQVLGTHFNINAYDDESVVKTTLLEGSVKVGKGSASKVIKPGEQALIENHGNPLIPKIIIQTVDTDEAVAWKEGRFLFKRTDIQSIMRQLSRWYNIDIVYKNVPSIGFNAKIPRNTSVSNILKALELTGEVKFIIEGNVVTVMQ